MCKFNKSAVAALTLMALSANAVQLPVEYDVSGELKAGYKSDTGFTTSNSRVTVSTDKTFDNGLDLTGNVHLVKTDGGYSVMADMVSQSSIGTVAIGSYQGIDRRWGNLATVTRTFAGDGLFTGESNAVSLMTPAYYGFTAGVSLNTVSTQDGNKDGAVVGLRYKLKGLSVTTTAGKLKDDTLVRKQFAISYTNDLGRVAFEKIQRTPTDSDTTASLICAVNQQTSVYVEKRINVSEANGKVNTTAAGIKYTTSKLTDFIVEKSNTGKAFIGVISRF